MVAGLSGPVGGSGPRTFQLYERYAFLSRVKRSSQQIEPDVRAAAPTLDDKRDMDTPDSALPIPLDSLARYTAPDGRISCLTIDTVHLLSWDPGVFPAHHPGLPSGAISTLRPWEYDTWWSRDCGSPDQFGVTPQVSYNHWAKPTRNRHYTGGIRDGLTITRFEAGRLSSYGESGLLPVDPALLDMLPTVLSNFLSHLSLGWMARHGEVSRFDLAVNIQLRSESEWDRIVQALLALRDYLGLVDAYDGKGMGFVHPDRPGSLTGIGMKTKAKKATWAFVAYRLDLLARKKRYGLDALAGLVVRLEFRFLNGPSVSKFLPTGVARTLPNIAREFAFLAAIEWFLRKRLGLGYVADPTVSDSEVIDGTRCLRVTKERLRALIADCRSRGPDAVRLDPPAIYGGDQELLNADFRRLDALGLVPWAADRQVAFMVRDMVIGAAVRFQEDFDAAREATDVNEPIQEDFDAAQTTTDAREAIQEYTLAEVNQLADTQQGRWSRYAYDLLDWFFGLRSPTSPPVRICLIYRADGWAQRAATWSRSRAPPSATTVSKRLAERLHRKRAKAIMLVTCDVPPGEVLCQITVLVDGRNSTHGKIQKALDKLPVLPWLTVVTCHRQPFKL